MIVQAILNAQRHGLSLYAHGSQLDVSGDPSTIERLLPAIKAHKSEIINYLQSIPTDPLVRPCPICAGVDFIHGHRGGYFCTTCQPDARPGTLVWAGGTRRQEQPTRSPQYQP